MCGQMSGSTDLHQLLIGLGLRQFSVAAQRHSGNQAASCGNRPSPIASASPQRAMSMESAQTIKNYLREELKKCCRAGHRLTG